MPYPPSVPHRGPRVQMTAEYLSHETFGRFGQIVRQLPNGAVILLHQDRQHPDRRVCFFSAGAYTEIRETA